MINDAPASRPRIEDVPRRIFLDSSVLQLLHDYGQFIWERQGLAKKAPIRIMTNGVAMLDALQKIFSLTSRGNWEMIVSKQTLHEVNARGNAAYEQWVSEVFAVSDDILAQDSEAFAPIQQAHHVFEWKRIGYLSVGDKKLLADAVRYRCDAFLTCDLRMARNAEHLSDRLRLMVLTPVELWDILRPWAALFV